MIVSPTTEGEYHQVYRFILVRLHLYIYFTLSCPTYVWYALSTCTDIYISGISFSCLFILFIHIIPQYQ